MKDDQSKLRGKRLTLFLCALLGLLFSFTQLKESDGGYSFTFSNPIEQMAKRLYFGHDNLHLLLTYPACFLITGILIFRFMNHRQ